MAKKSSKPAPSVPSVPSGNWKALKAALNPSATTSSPDKPRKRKRDDHSSSKPLKPAKPAESAADAEAIARAKSAESKGKRRELPIASILQGATESWQEEIGQYLAIDCEMVGVGPEGVESVLARVSIVNYHGAVILDRFVRPKEKVTDYRTWVSGVREEDLRSAPTFAEVQREVADLIKDRILIGHAITNDTAALLLSHPRHLVRDTAKYPPLQGLARTKRPGLKSLAKLVLDMDIQSGEHSSIDDARATMAIYRSQKTAWEDSLRTHVKPKLVTNSTPALQALDLSEVSTTGVKKSGRPKTLGLAATLRTARAAERELDELEHKPDREEIEEQKAKKARREEDSDLVLGFDFEPAQTVERVVVDKAVLRAKGKLGGAGKDKPKKVASRAFKGDREKRPASQADWWE